MGKWVRTISKDGNILCIALDSTDAVAQAERIHRTSATVTAALGRLLSAASIMGMQLKSENDTVTLRLNGGGPAGILLAISQADGDVRGYAYNNVVELPLNADGKLDVAGAVGRSGTLTVSRDSGTHEPYIGQTPIVSGEIAEDITHYYALSEQIPTVCALGVLVNPDLSVCAAGGYLLQLLPGANEGMIGMLESNIQKMQPVSTLIHGGSTPRDIAFAALSGFAPRVLAEGHMQYRCTCTRMRMERALISLGHEELMQMSEEPLCELCCHFCGKKETFSKEELCALAQSHS